MADCIFAPARSADAEQIFALYARRVEWMNAHGVHQWNENGYLDAFPLSYYQQQQQSGRLYALTCGKQRKIVGAAVLLEADERWDGHAEQSAFYIHNLVTRTDAKGAGKIMLAEIEKLARIEGKTHLRLDCAVNNAFLNNYYTALGYVKVGSCTDGPYYEGNLREKTL